MKTRKIKVPVLTRVEGEGALNLEITNNQISKMELNIFEPPRYFEGLLINREYQEVPDITARICGICPVAYQMTSSRALENAFDVKVTPWINAMRRLLYYGEWIQSHALHIHLLAAPDFFGFDNVISMAAKYPKEVSRGLALQSLGNDIMRFCAGRSVHPIGTRVGGFYHAPSVAKAHKLLAEVEKLMPQAEVLLNWTTSIELPNDEQDFISVAMYHPDEYAILEGTIRSSKGLEIPAKDFQKHFKEFQVPHSTALHCRLENEDYLVGPLARMNLNYQQLPDNIKKTLSDADISFPSKNMFHSIVARAAEIVFVMLAAQKMLQNYQETSQPYMKITPKKSNGYAFTEAPRGVLWHKYEVNEKGLIDKAVIVPPTSQNQTRIEQDLTTALTKYGLEKSDEDLTLRAETIIRNYDPCISCATHFLNLNIRRL